MSESDERPAADSDETRAQGAAARAAQTIGPYRLLEPIGEGGMGEVWLAEQARPVRRKVALKIIKAGMDTAQVVARFEAERQALALMDHPAIARVFEAGATAEGRPCFAMEYVRGESITTYRIEIGRASLDRGTPDSALPPKGGIRRKRDPVAGVGVVA